MTVLAIAMSLLAAAPADDLSEKHFRSALSFYKADQPEKSRAELLKCLEIKPEHKNAVALLVELQAEKFKESEGAYNETLKEFFYRGLTFFRKGENEKAAFEWKKGLEVSPGNAQLKAFLEKVKAQKPEEPVKEAVLPLPRLAAKREQAPLKERKASVPASVDKTVVEDLYYKGVKLYKQGKVDEAASCWEQVLKLDPSNSKAKKNLEKARGKEEKL